MNKIGRVIRTRRGFTMIELLAVIAILGFLAAIVAVNASGWVDRARVRTCKIQIANFEHALDLYAQMHNQFPRTDEGLQALVKDELLEKGLVPKDPWGHDYVYYFPGTVDPNLYDIISYGKDGQPGGEDFYADISNHTIRQEMQQGKTD